MLGTDKYVCYNMKEITPEVRVIMDGIIDKLKNCSRHYVFDYDSISMEKVRKCYMKELDKVFEDLCKKYPGSFNVEVNPSPTDKDKLDITVTLPRHLCSEEFLEQYDKE